MPHMMEAAVWIVALIGVLVSVITLVVCGILVPRSALRDLKEERNYYREAATACASAVMHQQQKVHELLNVLDKARKERER